MHSLCGLYCGLTDHRLPAASRRRESSSSQQHVPKMVLPVAKRKRPWCWLLLSLLQIIALSRSSIMMVDCLHHGDGVAIGDGLVTAATGERIVSPENGEKREVSHEKDEGPSSRRSYGAMRLQLERRTRLEDRMDAFRNAVEADMERMHRRIAAAATVVQGDQRRSLLQQQQQGSLNVISGSSVGSGEYLVSVAIGSPPQKVYLIADTGSDLTWVKCNPGRGASSSSSPSSSICDRESHPCSPATTNHSFYPASSSSFAPLSCYSSQCAAWFFPPTCDRLLRRCKFTYSYEDASFVTGSLAFEAVILGSSSKVEVLLGCGSDYGGPNFDKAGGVIGLGLGPLSVASQLADQTSTGGSSSPTSNKFSYCLADFFGPSSMSGSLAFGEALSQATTQQLQYTPFIVNPALGTFYYVGVQEVRVGGARLDITSDVWEIDAQGNGGVVVDSGSTLAQFSEPAYEAIRDAFQQAISYPPLPPVAGLDLCYNSSTTSVNIEAAQKHLRFPEFAIVLQGNLLFQPPQENYFTEAAPGITCLAMQGVPPPGFSVIGNLLQQNYHIEFDRLHNRLGLAPADCSKLH